MPRSQNVLTLLCIQFESANQKKNFGRYQSYTKRNLKKKPRSSGEENDTDQRRKFNLN